MEQRENHHVNELTTKGVRYFSAAMQRSDLLHVRLVQFRCPVAWKVRGQP